MYSPRSNRHSRVRLTAMSLRHRRHMTGTSRWKASRAETQEPAICTRAFSEKYQDRVTKHMSFHCDAIEQQNILRKPELIRVVTTGIEYKTRKIVSEVFWSRALISTPVAILATILSKSDHGHSKSEK